MVRCPRCGLRLRDEQPICLVHGAVPAGAVASGGSERRSKVADAVHSEEAFEALGYSLRRELGRGGFGVVYEAVRRVDGLPVALKVAMPAQRDAQALLDREADAGRHDAAIELLALVDGAAPIPLLEDMLGTCLLYTSDAADE